MMALNLARVVGWCVGGGKWRGVNRWLGDVVIAFAFFRTARVTVVE